MSERNPPPMQLDYGTQRVDDAVLLVRFTRRASRSLWTGILATVITFSCAVGAVFVDHRSTEDSLVALSLVCDGVLLPVGLFQGFIATASPFPLVRRRAFHGLFLNFVPFAGLLIVIAV